ncbi:cytochrome P450 [Mycena vulgaris]|nr:cytochrome P450 [Mycena vulgaris]
MSLYLYFGASVAALALWKWSSQHKRTLPLPPGPLKLPLVGNLFDMPSKFEWETYMKWSQIYNSNIIHLVHEIWRKYRRLSHQAFNATAARNYRPKERAASHEVLRRLLRDPDNVMEHLSHMAGDIIMSVAYGINVLPENDPYIELAKEAVHTLVIASVPGRFLVDALPVLKYVPDWLPGAGFKRTAKTWHKLARAMIDSPFAHAKRAIAAGNAPASFTSVLLGKIDDSESVKAIAGNIQSNPEAQKKAQLEIDSVVGNGRLPDFDDEDSLPPKLVAMYPDAYVFNADRFLLDGKPNPAVRNPDAAFGFRRSIVLAAFDIRKAIGDDGQIIEPAYEYFPGLVSLTSRPGCPFFSNAPSSLDLSTVDLIHTTINAEEQA